MNLPISGCVVVPMGRYVVAMDSSKDPNGWGLPGGKANPGESPEQAAARECEEETGIRPRHLVSLYRAPCVGEVTYDCHTFLAESWDGELRTSIEGTPHWVLPTNLLEGKYGQYNAGVLTALDRYYAEKPLQDLWPTIPVIAVVGNKGSGKDSTGRLVLEQGFTGIAFADYIKRLANRLFGFGDEALFGGGGAGREGADTRGLDMKFWERVYDRARAAETDVVHPFRFTSVGPAEVRLGLRNQLEWLCTHGQDLTPRLALQRFGTEWGRALYDNVWIDEVRRGIAKIEAGYGYERPRGFTDDPVPGAKKAKGAIVTDCRFLNEVKAVQSWGGKVFWVDAEKRKGPPDYSHASEPRYAEFEDAVDGVIDNNGDEAQLEREVRTKILRGAR